MGSAGPDLPSDLGVLRALRTGEAVRGLELQQQRPDGTSCHLTVDAVPLVSATGAAESVVLCFRDVTELRPALETAAGQALTALKLLLETGGPLEPEALTVRHAEAAFLAGALAAELRELSLEFQPAMLNDLGLLPALRWLFEGYARQAGVQVRHTHGGPERRFDTEVETAAYRIVQGALTNVARHAGVINVAVRTCADAEGLEVQVDDRGRGFDANAPLRNGAGSGLAGLRDRALLLGARYSLTTAPRKGTYIEVWFPLVADRGRV